MKEFKPKEYFDFLKDNQVKVTDEGLKTTLINAYTLLETYKKTGQVKAQKKLEFYIESLIKVETLLKKGIDTYVLQEDIIDYIENVSDEVVKIIELRNYEREIPAEIIETIEEVGDLFDEMFVVFTDYTGEAEKMIEEERKEKDPILFGVFKNDDISYLIENFFFLGDWEDEYCDLTLDKMIKEMDRPITKETKDLTEMSLEDLKEVISNELLKEKTKKENKGLIRRFIDKVNNSPLRV